ncbi:DUF397 domain-containing protein [Streptomyces sp. NBC_00268]|nr:DUF397 domain-containing protein [Streptomyces sp. NBC_01764]MCX5184805.1 DUF397 domain-containing protein [Streptomyces sp. NBC_00268]
MRAGASAQANTPPTRPSSRFPGVVPVHDSENRDREGPVIVVSVAGWLSFVAAIVG